VPVLPEDVVEIIFYNLFPDHPFSSPDIFWSEYSRNEPCTARRFPLCKACLAAFYLLSRAWLNPTRRILYRTITHPYSSTLKGPLLWNLLNSSPHLRTYILRIHIHPKYTHNTSLNEMAKLLPRCTISIRIPGSGHQSPYLMTSLNCIGYLRAGWERMEGYTTDMWISAFTNWSRLEVLHIQCRPLWFPFELAEQDGMFLPSLRILRIIMAQDSIPIPPASFNTLHTLCLAGLENLKLVSFIRLVRRHSQSSRRVHVSHVTFDVDNGSPNEVLADAIAQLTSLESLFIHQDGEYLLDTMFSNLPVLVHLRVLPFRWTSPHAIFRDFVSLQVPRRNHLTITINLQDGNRQSKWGKMWDLLNRKSDQITTRIIFDGQCLLPPWAEYF
jgi:hypothetical protein